MHPVSRRQMVTTWGIPAVMWVLNETMMFAGHLGRAQDHIFGGIAVTSTIWALLRDHRLRACPGSGRWVTAEDYRASERLIIETIAAVHGENCVMQPSDAERARRLRSV